MSTEPWNPSEIPGITTYLDSENRHREPHEYIGGEDPYDKVKTLEKRIEELEANASDIWDLQDQVGNLEDELSDAEQAYKDLELDKQDLEIQVDNLGEELKTLELAHEQGKEALKIVDKFMPALKQYGHHAGDCNYIVLLYNRRPVTEEKDCSCGWYETYKELCKC